MILNILKFIGMHLILYATLTHFEKEKKNDNDNNSRRSNKKGFSVHES